MKGRTLADQKKVKKMSAGGSSMSLMHSQPMGPMASKSKSLLPSALQQRLQTRMNAVKQGIADRRVQAKPVAGGMKTGGISKRK